MPVSFEALKHPCHRGVFHLISVSKPPCSAGVNSQHARRSFQTTFVNAALTVPPPAAPDPRVVRAGRQAEAKAKAPIVAAHEADHESVLDQNTNETSVRPFLDPALG